MHKSLAELVDTDYSTYWTFAKEGWYYCVFLAVLNWFLLYSTIYNNTACLYRLLNDDITKFLPYQSLAYLGEFWCAIRKPPNKHLKYQGSAKATSTHLNIWYIGKR